MECFSAMFFSSSFFAGPFFWWPENTSNSFISLLLSFWGGKHLPSEGPFLHEKTLTGLVLGQTTKWFLISCSPVCMSLFYFLKILFIFIFRERVREGEREVEIHQCVVASHMPLLGTWPATQACALTGNWTSDPVVLRPALDPLSHTGECCMLLF